MMEGKKFSTKNMKTYLSYASGQIQDGIPYNFINYYLLMFMTDMVGLSPAVAGVILFIAVLWDGITDPAVGYLSDNLRGRYGKRRPFLLGSIVPVILSMLLLFAPWELPEGLKFPYYLVVTLFFWTSYTCYSIPFNSFGAEVVKDTNSRNNLKTICVFLLYFGVWLATAAPQFIQMITAHFKMTEKTSWFCSAAVLALLGGVSALVCWRATRGLEEAGPKAEPNQKEEKMSLKRGIKNVTGNYGLLLRTRAVRIICLMSLVYWHIDNLTNDLLDFPLTALPFFRSFSDNGKTDSVAQTCAKECQRHVVITRRSLFAPSLLG